jgi:hypothetical protein
MAVDYSIAAIPTVYAARRYRSRLEARWAAFFDVMGWPSEYEPYDLGTWSPDFLLRSNPEGATVLAEIKPIHDRDRVTCAKMEKAARASGWHRHGRALLLLGVSPWREEGLICIGWTGVFSDDVKCFWGPAALVGNPRDSSEIDVTLVEADRSMSCLFTYRPLDDESDCGSADDGMARWAAASNFVQWRGRSNGQ